MKRLIIKVMVGAACALSACGAMAQQCAGFSDVLASSGFCPNVEWIKNRGITLGCVTPTGQPPGSYYCPDDAVSRLAMAAFMQRLGKALTVEVIPDHVGLNATTIPGESPANPLILCETMNSTVVAYPRKALLHASVTGLADGNPVAWRAFWLYSVDSGVVFQTLLDVGGQTLSNPRASSSANQWSGTALAYTFDLPANTPLAVKVGVRRDDILIGTTGNFANVRCQMTMSIVNANGTASPL